MRIEIVTIFPEMFAGPLNTSIIKRALQNNLVEIQTINFRNYATGKHSQVDDYPYGGGAGMVLKPEPVFRALEDLRQSAVGEPRVILLSPQGKIFDQRKAAQLAKCNHLILVCGHYEGVDERIRQYAVDEEISIGDFVLTGGELPAMIIVDAVVRLIPGVLGDERSAEEESFSDGLLEYPQYTRPRDFRSLTVPDVLLSGNHQNIREWRRLQSLLRTRERRPDLWEKLIISEEDLKLLETENGSD